jgi:hypothetical protein
MGNRLCDCNNAPEYLQYDYNYLQSIHDGGKVTRREEVDDISDGPDEMKIEVIDSYNVDNNIFNLSYIRKLIRLQRCVKDYLVRKSGGQKKLKAAVINLHGRTNSLLSNDVGTMLSHKSSKVSKAEINNYRFEGIIYT